MKILFLACANSIHTQKWAKGIAQQGHQVHIFSIGVTNSDLYQDYKNITTSHFKVSPSLLKKSDGNFGKISYLKAIKQVRQLHNEFKPDFTHIHYATSYGLLAVLAKIKDFYVSVWGSDIFDFPQKSILHKWLIKLILSKAKLITSTSHTMKRETLKYTTKNVKVIHFGVDIDKFIPVKKTDSEDEIKIGTVKTLSYKYGIDTLIESFSIVKKQFPDKMLSLTIVGKGEDLEALQELAKNLNVLQNINFTGAVPHSEVIKYHQSFDIAVYLSRLDSESFGVAIVESCACGTPVVVSSVAGPAEVIDNEVTGLIVPPNDPESAAEAIISLITDTEKRKLFGANGRAKSIKEYNWQDNLEQMLSIYQ